jgi:biopolymer transport protein ExbD
MKCLLSVCFVAFALIVIAARNVPTTAQTMQQGISVQLAATNNAAPVPDADNEDAWIVTVTNDGSLYFGVQPVTLDNLAKQMKERPRNREQKLYIKADARAPFANIKRVLEVGRETFFADAVLLTSQPESPRPGTLVPPKGIEVMVDPARSASANTIDVLDSGRESPVLKINDRQIPWTSLPSTLMQIFQNQPQKVVVIKADDHLPFANVIQVIDTCRSTGAQVAVMTQGLSSGV